MVRLATAAIEELREPYEAHGQEHVFDFWDALDNDAREPFAEQLLRIGAVLPELIEQRASALSALEQTQTGEIQPYPALALPEHGGDESAFERAREAGEELLHQGRVGVFVVAGGQGTRLGFEGPKGAYPVGPVSDRCLFEIQAQKLTALAQRFGRSPHWFIMTSPATDSETRALFARQNHFGLDPDQIHTFPQGTVPAWSLEGKLILEHPNRIFESPGGHGDAYSALSESGALDRMAEAGHDRLFYYQVDNPLIQMADPLLLGFHETTGAEMSCKVVRKVDPMEKLGVMVVRGNRPELVEYTELRDSERNARDDRDQLLFWAGNIAIHVFNRDFLERVADDTSELLPYHASIKNVPRLDSEGKSLSSSEPNGHKLERFVFDALPAASSVCVLEARAVAEFAPIKNATGNDSPEVARAQMTAQYREWLALAGLSLPPKLRAIEIDHSLADSAAELASRGLTRWENAGESIRILTGTKP